MSANFRTLKPRQILRYIQYLHEQEHAPGTLEKYRRDIGTFSAWLRGRPVTRGTVSAWKHHLCTANYAPATINSMLSALNGLFRFLDWNECKVKFLKIQRQLFREERRVLNRSEYESLHKAAEQRGKTRLSLLMETICATGIRVSEIRYITVEAARQGRADIALKGKLRTILLPGKLCRKLLKYAKKEKIASGEIFLTRNGKGLSRRQIWAEMKTLCRYAGVTPFKVFPHNLRHLFASTFYRVYKDIVQLADLLGHSNIETTRIYLLSSGAEHARQLERLGLIS